MRAIRAVITSVVLALAVVLAAAVPAGAVICHDYPGGCCGDVKVLGKTVLRIDC